ncbi:MAG: Cell division protein FtsA [Alphaproteobacteria bacterium MarineAlpha5_Bin5]|nr:MAG: Cell division protein FtsA [Alphaproteobacteria bacterium MarineAlpha5_Bin5]PPR49905.1 MAG: Cell division protein FtsA [Alphaproteobacteria bacterium MarineAlpha5_Bin4]|tara:strand:+ start:3335 stop:4555 length:1221 start_codon:yes stop_codon:yes gene_type:complete
MIKVGLNFGNSKISCVVVDYKNNENINVLSVESYPCSLIKKNIITDYTLLLSEIKKLIIESEKKSQTKINSINLNISTVDSISKYYESEIFISDQQITDLHLKKAINQSEYFDESENYFNLINDIIAYDLDKRVLHTDPIGNYANNIKIYFYKLQINYKYLKNISNLIKDLKLKIDSYIPTPLSSALSTLSKDERNLGTICIDLGHSTTSTSIFENNKFIYGDSFLVGSNNVTTDIARGVSTTLSSAERLKTLYGSIISSPSDEHEIIEIPFISGENNKFTQISRSTINAIIKPRIEETLEIVWQNIKQNNLHNKKIKNVVITGGGSQLEGIIDYAKVIFSSNVRIGNPLEFLNLNDSFKKPTFSDVIGATLFEKNEFSINFIKKQPKKLKKLGFSGFISWLDQYI